MLVKNNKETTMKFKSVAAATLAVATLFGMSACGTSNSADDNTIVFGTTPPLVMASSTGRISQKLLKKRIPE